jgi:hypothetical protein
MRMTTKLKPGMIHLMQHLQKKRIEPGMIPGLIWSMKSCYLAQPGMDWREMNRRLAKLGWRGVDLDSKTLAVAVACFDRSEKDSCI